MIDSHTHLDLCEPANTELVAAAEAAGVVRILTVGTDGVLLACRARRRRGLPAGLCRRRPAPELGGRLRRRRPRRAARRSPPTSAASRSARAALTSTGTERPRSRPAARLRRPDRPRARKLQAAGDPLPRRRGADARPARARSRRRQRGDALLLDARPPGSSACERGYAISFAGNVTYRSAGGPRGGRGPRSLGAAARRDRRPLPGARARAGPPQPARLRRAHARVRRRPAGRRAGRARPRRCRRTRRACSAGHERTRACAGAAEPAPHARVRGAPGPRSRPELPDRLEHPRRDRPCRRAAEHATWCSRSAAASASCPSTWPTVSPTCTWSRSTSA